MKANRFGDGIGFAAMCWDIGLEIDQLAAVNMASEGNDIPVAQLLNNDGTPLRPLVINGISNLGLVTLAEADVAKGGGNNDIRISDIDYLANGNFVISAMSGQTDDWTMASSQTNAQALGEDLRWFGRPPRRRKSQEELHLEAEEIFS